MFWILIMELWAVNEEKLQFYNEDEYRHDLKQELAMFQLLKEIYMAKIERITKFEEKKKSAFTFEQNLAKMAQGSDILSKIQNKIREDAEGAASGRQDLNAPNLGVDSARSISSSAFKPNV